MFFLFFFKLKKLIYWQLKANQIKFDVLLEKGDSQFGVFFFEKLNKRRENKMAARMAKQLKE